MAISDQRASPRSPLRQKPLRVPGEGLDHELDLLRNEKATEAVLAAAFPTFLAFYEWVGYLAHLPRRPIVLSLLAGVCIAYALRRILRIRTQIRRVRLGRDGERVVGQKLEALRAAGAQVFHDVPGDDFNLDHVVVSPRGIYVIETKTVTKPSPNARITVEGAVLRIDGRIPSRDPIVQASSEAAWLQRLIESSTGKRFPVRGVAVYPGWFVEQRTPRESVWVLEPKALPAFIASQSARISEADVALVSFHLSQYVQG